MSQIIGSINACIGGDTRYTSIVRVVREGSEIKVLRIENGAVGGSDGPGSAHDFGVQETVTLTSPTPALLVKTIKRLFDTTIVRYGKPSLRFTWLLTREMGLSADKAARALARE